jgi:hypothetical protein
MLMTAELHNILDGHILPVRSRPPRHNRQRRVLQLSATRHGFTVAGLEPEPELAPPVFENFGLARACAWALCEQLTYSASHSDGETRVLQADRSAGDLLGHDRLSVRRLGLNMASP